MINKDTKLYGSFSRNAGNNGCMFFNAQFKKHNIDALYKSYSVDNISNAVFSARTLGFSGFAISMPYKVEVLEYVDVLSDEVKFVGSSNTIVREESLLKAYNTDYLTAVDLLRNISGQICILGEGGLGMSLKSASKFLCKEYSIINRSSWSKISHLRNQTVINCTPVNIVDVHESNLFIDLRVSTDEGKKFAENQAKKQFYLYTGVKL